VKYVIIIPDGCADEPQEALGGQTPLQAANVPAMDEVARTGCLGRANHTPADLPAGSDVANLSLLGYDPRACYTGRAPLEAAAQGIELGPLDWAVRCNLVTIEEQVMRSFTAGHVSSEEAAELLRDARSEFSTQPLAPGLEVELYPGVGYRNLLVIRCADETAPFSVDTRTTPPHDLTDGSVQDDFPRGPGSELLTHLMSESGRIFADHPVNQARREVGKLPVTNMWLWGLGRMPQLEPFAETYGPRGAMITAVDLLRGLGRLLGWRRIDVPGATGYLDTDYAAKGQYAVEALRDEATDLVCVHVEAPDEAAHEGNATEKARALEQISQEIVEPVHAALREHGEYRILVSPDHPTFCRTKTHEHGDVPLVVAGTGIEPDAAATYDDPSAAESALAFPDGWRLMEWFLKAKNQ
jgi:2,3-bisphosphoglycerate-independent phosphoglycerate mutase